VWSGTWNGPGSCPIAFHGPDGGGKLGCDRLAHSENVLVEATVPMGRKPFKLCIQKVPAAGVEAERLPNCPFLSSRYAATSFHMSEVCWSGVPLFLKRPELARSDENGRVRRPPECLSCRQMISCLRLISLSARHGNNGISCDLRVWTTANEYIACRLMMLCTLAISGAFVVAGAQRSNGHGTGNGVV
jgi:hypothetical protein